MQSSNLQLIPIPIGSHFRARCKLLHFEALKLDSFGCVLSPPALALSWRAYKYEPGLVKLSPDQTYEPRLVHASSDLQRCSQTAQYEPRPVNLSPDRKSEPRLANMISDLRI